MISYSPDVLLHKLKFVLDEDFKTLDEAIETLEIDLENDVTSILDDLGIVNSRKTDRKSLPVQKTVERKKYFSSFFNETLSITVLKRMLLRELLVTGQCKIRFFVSIEPCMKGDKIISLDYKINWYQHECI